MKKLLTHLSTIPFVLFILCFPTHAHQLDEYLQSTLVSIAPNQINLSINLTPGVAIANQVLTDIDANHDGTISTNEASNYCEQLKRDLTITLDSHPLTANLTSLNFPETTADLTNGFGIIQAELSIATTLASGEHKLTIQNHHFPKISAYLVNATQPKSPQIQITTQTRNQTQSTTTIAFTFQQPITRSKKIAIFTGLATLCSAMFFYANLRTSNHPSEPTRHQ